MVPTLPHEYRPDLTFESAGKTCRIERKQLRCMDGSRTTLSPAARLCQNDLYLYPPISSGLWKMLVIMSRTGDSCTYV